MTNKYIKSIFGLSVLASAAFVYDAAMAQALQPPTSQIHDAMGVNLSSGRFDVPNMEIDIGDSKSGLRSRSNYLADSNLNFIKYADGVRVINTGTNGSFTFWMMNVSYNGITYTFVAGIHYDINQYSAGFSNGPYLDTYNKAKLQCTSTPSAYYYETGSCVLTTEDGTIVTYDNTLTTNTNYPTKVFDRGFATSAVRPDGETINYEYKVNNGYRSLKAVVSSLGWMIKYDDAGKIGAVNLAKNYCTSSAAVCNYNNRYTRMLMDSDPNSPSVQGTSTILSGEIPITKVTTKYFGTHFDTHTLVSPSGVTKIVKYNVGTDAALYDRVMSINNGGQTWNYTYALDSEKRTTVNVTQPDLNKQKVTLDGPLFLPIIYEDQLGRKTLYEYAISLVLKVVPPEGNATTGGYNSYSYNTYGDLVSESRYPRGGGSPLVRSLTYPSSCDSTNFRVCHKPLTATDPMGNHTDYTYAPEHGGVLTETGPADANGVRPQTRYEYTPLNAKYMDSSGNLQNFPPVYRLTKVSKCKTATTANPASCVGTADELIKTYTYNAPNLQLTSETQSTGNGSISSTISYGYDDIGNKVWTDGPRTDVDDKTYVTYDVLRRPVFEIGMDPDGGGPLRRATIKHNYDVDGREWKTENGTCGTVSIAGSIPNGCNDFVVNSFTRNTYDASTGLLAKTEVVQP